MIRTSLFAAATLVAGLQPALSSETIAYEPAALEDPANVAALYSEISATAHKVCRAALRGDPHRHYKMDRCVEETTADAVAQANSPELTAYAAGDSAERRLALLQ